MMNTKEDWKIKSSRWPWMFLLMVCGLFGSALIFGGVGAVWAGGEGHGHKHDPKSKLERMTKKLDLTQEQQDTILPILQEKHEKMEALHNQMKEVRQNAMTHVEAQLTPEQQEKFQKAKEERKNKMKEYKEKYRKGKGHEKGKHDKHEDDD